MEPLAQVLQQLSEPKLCASQEVYKRFVTRIDEGGLTRDENRASHYCVYFLPYNLKTQEVFIVHHKKAEQWLAPGGHIDEGEVPLQTLEREMGEELGFSYKSLEDPTPFLLTITPISNPVQPCRKHFDIWYGIPTVGSDFHIDPREFHETRWLSVPKARQLVTDPPNLQALYRIKEFF